MHHGAGDRGPGGPGLGPADRGVGTAADGGDRGGPAGGRSGGSTERDVGTAINRRRAPVECRRDVRHDVRTPRRRRRDRRAQPRPGTRLDRAGQRAGAGVARAYRSLRGAGCRAGLDRHVGRPGAANARLVLTVPQSLLDATPEVVRIIAAAERQAARGATHPPGPFRVHRMPMWNPALWSREASDDRIKEFDRWEHDTIRPKYGLLHAIEYTLSSGVAEIDAYAEFFGGFRIHADAATAGHWDSCLASR